MNEIIQEFQMIATQSTTYTVIALAAIAGLVRGFAGFGAGMMFLPPVGAILSPQIAILLIWIIDGLPALPAVIKTRKKAEWKVLTPLLAMCVIAVPVGIFIMKNTDPLPLRWTITFMIFGFLAILWSGWRYHKEVKLKGHLAVGTIAGLMGGIAALPALPVMIFMLSGERRAEIIRSNMTSFMMGYQIIAGITLWLNGLFTIKIVLLGLLCIPAYLTTLWAGTSVFKVASDTMYRKIAFTMIFISAVLSLPLLDGIIRSGG